MSILVLLGSLLFLPIVNLSGRCRAACPEPPETSGAGRKGLAKRDFSKALRHELDLLGGVYASEVMGMAPVGLVAYTFHINEDFGLELDFGYTKFFSPLVGPVKTYTGYAFLENHDARIYLGNLVWHPFHGKFMFFDAAIPHFDFFLLAGLGVTDSRLSKGLTYNVGIGMKIYFTSWLSARIDIRDQIYVQEILASERLTNNLLIVLGVGFWFPFDS
jgi:outer membrane beta-barrel protein